MDDALTTRMPERRGTASLQNGLTEVDLVWIEKRTEHWIRFGHITRERIIDRRRRIVSFAPGHVFAFVRWASNDHGTVLSRIDILRAARPGDPHQTVPFVRPGGEVLLRVSGWPSVDRVLAAIDAVEALDIDPSDVPSDYWCHVHNRLIARQEPRVYTRGRHIAWLKRREASR